MVMIAKKNRLTKKIFRTIRAVRVIHRYIDPSCYIHSETIKLILTKEKKMSFEQLFSQYRSGGLSAKEALIKILKENPEIHEEYLERMNNPNSNIVPFPEHKLSDSDKKIISFPKPEKPKFEDHVKSLISQGISRPVAFRAAKKTFPKLYEKYTQEGKSFDDIFKI